MQTRNQLRHGSMFCSVFFFWTSSALEKEGKRNEAIQLNCFTFHPKPSSKKKTSLFIIPSFVSLFHWKAKELASLGLVPNNKLGSILRPSVISSVIMRDSMVQKCFLRVRKYVHRPNIDRAFTVESPFSQPFFL